VLCACGGSSGGATGEDEAGAAASDDAAAPAEGGSSDGGSPHPAGDAGEDSSDGPPSRTAACTPLSQQTGAAVNSFHGRLDGFLTYVVPQGGPSSCNGDDSHIHLQVRVGGDVYDVAVDIGKFDGDVLLHETDMAIPDGSWSEGWHGSDGLSYPQLGLSAGQFVAQAPASLAQKLTAELASANHVSVFGKGYPQGNGCHDVHYVDGSNDGAIVIDPLSAKPHVVFLRFSTQSF
jgi:hypothetical protein